MENIEAGEPVFCSYLRRTTSIDMSNMIIQWNFPGIIELPA